MVIDWLDAVDLSERIQHNLHRSTYESGRMSRSEAAIVKYQSGFGEMSNVYRSPHTNLFLTGIGCETKGGVSGGFVVKWLSVPQYGAVCVQPTSVMYILEQSETE